MSLEARMTKRSQTTEVAKKDTIAALLESSKDQIARALPRHMTADRILRTALTAIRINPKLQECTGTSLIAGIMQSAQLGLDIGVLGRAFLVPYRNVQKGITEAQFQIGYKGLLDLIRRSGEISFVTAHVVYEKDKFNVEYGLDEKLEHVPHFSLGISDPGEPIGAYAVAKLKDGSTSFSFLTRKQIEAIRDKSPGYKNALKFGDKTNPWIDEVARESMWKKTSIIQLAKYLPMSIESADAIASDETVKNVIDVDMVTLPNELELPEELPAEANAPPKEEDPPRRSLEYKQKQRAAELRESKKAEKDAAIRWDDKVQAQPEQGKICWMAEEPKKMTWEEFHALLDENQKTFVAELAMNDEAKYKLAESSSIGFDVGKFLRATATFPKKKIEGWEE